MRKGLASLVIAAIQASHTLRETLHHLSTLQLRHLEVPYSQVPNPQTIPPEWCDIHYPLSFPGLPYQHSVIPPLSKSSFVFFIWERMAETPGTKFLSRENQHDSAVA